MSRAIDADHRSHSHRPIEDERTALAATAMFAETFRSAPTAGKIHRDPQLAADTIAAAHERLPRLCLSELADTLVAHGR
jgi:hypothetical protein